MPGKFLRLLRSALEQNTNGVMSMQKGNMHAALQLFKSGLASLLAEVSASGDEDLAPITLDCENSIVCRVTGDSDSNVVHEEKLLESVNSQFLPYNRDEGKIAIFNRPILVSPNITSSATQTDSNRYAPEILTSVLLYNSGLALHLCGLANASTRPLQRARQLYCLSQESLQRCWEAIPFVDRYSHPFDLIYVATETNIGHILAYSCMDTIELTRRTVNLTTRLSQTLSSKDQLFLSEEEVQLVVRSVSLRLINVLLTAGTA